MRYFADYIKGKPYQKTVLWENSNTSAVFDAQIVTLEDSISNYDEIGIYYKVSRSDNDSSAIPVFMNVDDFKKTSSTGDSFIFGNTIVIGSFGYGRMIYYVSDTSIQIMTCYKFNASASSNYNAIPVKIIGIKKGLGEVNPPVAEKFTFSIGTTETVITLPHAPKSIVALYNTSSSYPKAGTCMYDVVNEIFLKSSGTGVWTKFEVDGDKLTLLGDNSTGNWTYDCIVV